MRLGDQVLFYQSQQGQAIVGILKVTREAYPDPTSADPQWMICDFAPIATFPSPISLEAIKNSPALSNLPLIRRPRLSVMPLTANEFENIQALAQT